jgi:hypothetical protein
LADVYDRWHKSHPKPTEAECGEHKSRTRQMVPTADHGIGKRWQVRYRDLDGHQRKENFHTKAEADNRAAEVDVEIRHGSYVVPARDEADARRLRAEVARRELRRPDDRAPLRGDRP